MREMFENKGQINNRFAGAPVTKWLLILNIAAFLIDFVNVGYHVDGRLFPYGAYMTELVFQSGQVWRLISFQFLHANELHIAFNMFAVFMFGGMVERALGLKRFLAYYLLCGVAGALFYSLLVQIGWLDPGILVGASAGIFGILVALIVIAPDMQIMLLFPPIPMKMKTFGKIILGLGVFTVLTTGNNAGGEASHLGGAILGFLLMKQPWLLDWVDQLGQGQVVVRKPQRHHAPKIGSRTSVNMESSEVNCILDKVSEHGVHSLTDEERQTLLRNLGKDDE